MTAPTHAHTSLSDSRDVYGEFLDGLLSHGLFLDTGVKGVYGRGADFEDVLERVNRLASEAGRDLKAEVLWFPPVINRKILEKTDYLQMFPHFAGTVHSFNGNEREHALLMDEINRGEAWDQRFRTTDVAFAPAACYPVYANAAGTLPAGGRVFDVQSYCFRHEPSDDPARLQIFRMHEFVRLGTAGEVQAFRDMWIERGQNVLTSIGLDGRAVVANDPFFGRGGRMFAANQREQSLKFELVVPICSVEKPTAVVSCNYHQDHFGTSFGISTHDGAPSHSACVGFGLERITLALFKTHGFAIAQWPAEARRVLGLSQSRE